MSPIRVFGIEFRHPVLLAAGTCGFGEPVVDVMDLEEIGGLVTKSVTLEPRVGNPAPRVAEYEHGMLNSVGLANPGLEGVRRDKLPWMRQNLGAFPVIVSVAGHTPEEYCAVVEGLEDEDGFQAFELNLSCPNDTRLGGRPFSLDPESLKAVLDGVRPRTRRPLIVKLAPNDPAIAETAALAVAHGADGITAINTVPGFLARGAVGRPVLGAGPGGTSGPGILPVGLAAVRVIAQRVDVPVIGVGGILSPEDALLYFQTGASLVAVGTGSFADPRCGARVALGVARARSTAPHVFPALAAGAPRPVPSES
jgi:dihydroorotate dehydrogenase (NAD+) catalytic subunit